MKILNIHFQIPFPLKTMCKTPFCFMEQLQIIFWKCNLTWDHFLLVKMHLQQAIISVITLMW